MCELPERLTCPECRTELQVGDWPFPCHGSGDHQLSRRNNPSLHPTDRVIFFEHPQTGEVRIPGRTDRPMHPKYKRAGFVRREIESISGVREFERRTGKLCEPLHYDRGSATAERDTGAL